GVRLRRNKAVIGLAAQRLLLEVGLELGHGLFQKRPAGGAVFELEAKELHVARHRDRLLHPREVAEAVIQRRQELFLEVDAYLVERALHAASGEAAAAERVDDFAHFLIGRLEMPVERG